jgi:toxin CcdB
LLLDVQNDLIADLNTRVVAPLCPASAMKGKLIKTLILVFEIDGKQYAMLTPQLAGIAKKQVGAKVADLAQCRDEIIAKCSLTAGEGDSGRSGPANQVRKGRDHVQAGHPILEVRPEGDALFATGLLEAGEGVAASSPVRAAGAGADVPFLHHVPQVGLAAVVVDR